jgi:transcription termination factor Rho
VHGDKGEGPYVTDTTEIAAESSPRAALSALRLPELQAVAAQLGISGTARMRKSDLLEAIKAKQAGSSAPKTAEPAAPRASRRSAAPAGPPSQRVEASDGGSEPAAAPAAVAPAAEPAPEPVAARSTPPADEPRSDAASDETGQQSLPVDGGERRPRRERTGRDRGQERDGAERPVREPQVRDGQVRDGQARDGQNGVQNRDGGDRQPREVGDRQPRDAGQSRDQNGQQARLDRGPRTTGPHDEDDDERGGRRRRGRYRDRKRRQRGDEGGPVGMDEPEVGDDDVLLPVAGILDVLDNYAFLRTSGYLPGPNDVYVSLGQVKKYALRKGDAVVGAVRQPRDGDSSGQQQAGPRNQKFNALVRIDAVNGASPDEARGRPEFGKLTPLYPQERLRLETEANQISNRIIDLVAPIGKGQRGLIVSPPKAGKTLILQAIANAITVNNPECHLMVVLVDERPEEVTDMQRTIKGEVIASTFDRPADDHTTVAELAIERAKRLVELGHDVVVLLDSITRLGRAYNLAAPASGRILSGGVDSSALYPPKRFFGAARNVENGGSLTILATALVETGSKMDEVIFEEFKGTGNMELRLSRNLADKRIFPAVDVNASGTRREEILMSKEELSVVWKLRRVMGALEPQQAIELLLNRVKETKSNVEFLMQVQKTTPVPGRDDD